MTGSPKQSALYSILIHAGAIAAVLLATSGKNPPIRYLLPASLTDPKVYLPAHSAPQPGGGGGGQHEKLPPSRGNAPRRAPRLFVPPTVRLIDLHPRLAMEQTLQVNADMLIPVIQSPQIGDPNGVLGPLSDGPGGPYGIGTGDGPGIGPGRGPGYGPGPGGPGSSGNGTRGGSGSLIAPVVLYKTEPAYSDEARRAKLQGTVVLLIDVDVHGQPQNIRIVRSLGSGLDERAEEAVKSWKFKPGYRDGRPVATTAMIEVNFRLL
jgi:protein TonB